MAKYINDTVLDAAIDKIIAEGNLVALFDAYSTDYATINTNKLGSYVPTLTKADGDVSGRKLNLAAETGVAITVDGNFNNFAILNTTGSTVLYVGNGTTKALTNGDTVDTPSADLEFADPV